MSSLVYHPAYDPYGAILRSIRLLIGKEWTEKSRLRILDFLLLFPEFVEDFQLTASLRSTFRKSAIARRFAYEARPPAVRLFELMEPAFEAATQTLLAKGIVVQRSENESVWRLDTGATPNALLSLAKKRNEEEVSLLNFLNDFNREFELNGPKGLKARSGLMEYKYDAV